MRLKRFAVACAFGVYAAVLFVFARSFAHAFASGWLARLISMMVLAAGLFPLRHWLEPRVAACLSVLGRWVMVACYFTVVAPFAFIVKIKADPLAIKRSAAGSNWVNRVLEAPTLESARAEG